MIAPLQGGLLSDASYALAIALLLLLAPLAIVGVALLNAGLGRSRSAAQSLLGQRSAYCHRGVGVFGYRYLLGGKYEPPGCVAAIRWQEVGLDRY